MTIINVAYIYKCRCDIYKCRCEIYKCGCEIYKCVWDSIDVGAILNVAAIFINCTIK